MIVKEIHGRTRSCHILLFLIFLSVAFCLMTYVHAESLENETICIKGYQINTNTHSFRVLYGTQQDIESKVSNEPDEIGLIYGLDGYVKDSDMKVGTNNVNIRVYKATSQGKYNDFTWIRAMKLVDTAQFYTQKINVKAYIKDASGNYKYSKMQTFSVYAVAEYLYNNSLMSSEKQHRYLYDKILSKVDKDAEKITDLPNKVPQETETETAVQETTRVVQIPEDGWSPVIKP